jgi:ABC-2 type transport system ATP-binding protein
MLGLIRRVGTEFGIDVVLSSHLLEEVERICDSAIILRDGAVAAAGPLDALRGHGEGLVLELEGEPSVVEDALRLIKERGAEIRDDAARHFVTGGDDLYEVVRDAVAETGAGIRRLQPRRVSLEDVFLGIGPVPTDSGTVPPSPPPPPPPSPPAATA